MKKYLIVGLAVMSLMGCSKDEEQVVESDIEERSEEVVQSPYESMPDFPMPLESLVERYNADNKDGLTIMEHEGVEFEKNNFGYSKSLIDEIDIANNVDYNVKAMFDEDENFKRVIYEQTINEEPSEEANLVLFALFDTLGIDGQHVFDFYDSGDKDMEITTDKYKVTFMKLETLGFLSVVIDSK